MCGRVRCTLRVDDVSRACYMSKKSVHTVNADRYHPSYNVPPGSYLPVVRRGDASSGQDAVVHTMKWGLIPKFTRKDEKLNHYKMFNARSESINEKVSFRHLVNNNRCLVAVEGFYEWKKDVSKKQPYYIHFTDHRPLVLAALYDSWESSTGETMYTFTIVTTSSSPALNWLHDRMPVIFGDKASTDAWLHDDSSKHDLLLKPYDRPDLGWLPVTTAMGNPSFCGPECIQEIEVKGETKGLKSFLSRNMKQDESLTKDSSLGDEKDEKIGLKRHYNQLVNDDEIKKMVPGSAKKGGAGDKQPTLFSYFGKT